MDTDRMIFDLSKLQSLMVFIKQYQVFGFISLIELNDLNVNISKIDILKHELSQENLEPIELHALGIAGAVLVGNCEMLIKHCIKRIPDEEYERIDKYMDQQVNH